MSVGGAENIRKRQSTDGKYNREEAQSASSGVNVLVSIQKQLLTKGVRRKCPGGSLSQILSSSIIGSEVAESISKMALVLFHYRLESTHMCGRLFGNSNQLHMDCGRIKPRKPLRG